MGITQITDINELLTKAFQRECYLEDGHTTYYKLKFPCKTIIESQTFEPDCKKFLFQYNMEETGSFTFLFSETSKEFVLQINKLPLGEFLKKLDVLSTDVAFHEALHQLDVFQVKQLLDKGANINYKNIAGDTALHIATQKDYIVMVSLLLEKGASVNILNNEGKTALQIVDQKKDAMLGKAMINSALEIDPKTQKPNFTLHELRNYWEQRTNLTYVPSTPITMIGATGETVELSPGDQRVKTVIKFFSPAADFLTQKQVEKPLMVANLGK